MTCEYFIIRDAVPVSFSADCGLIWDSVRPYVYTCSSPVFEDSPARSYLYRYNRDRKAIDLIQKTANGNTPYGSPAIDKDGKLYFSPPGGTSFTFQYHGAFDDNLEFTERAEQKISSTSCTLVSSVAGDYVTDQYAESDFWWQVGNADLFTGSVYCFYRNKFCDVDNPESKALLLNYVVPQTLMQSPGGFFSNGYRIRSYVGDSSGVFWVYVAGPDANGVPRHNIWKITQGGGVSLDGDLSSTFATFGPAASDSFDGRLRWFGDDNTLILSNRILYVKYAPGGVVLKTLDTTGLGGKGRWSSGTNITNFRHPDRRLKSLWIGSDVIDSSVAVPSGGLSRFPRFTEIRMSDLTFGRDLICHEVGAAYPFVLPHGTFRWFFPFEALQFPDTGELWASSARRIIGVFKFSEVEPIPPIGNPIGIAPYCLPKNRDTNPFRERVLVSPGLAGSANTNSFINDKKL